MVDCPEQVAPEVSSQQMSILKNWRLLIYRFFLKFEKVTKVMKLYQNQNLHVKISGFSFHVSMTIETARPILSKSWQRAFSLYWAKQARFRSFFCTVFHSQRSRRSLGRAAGGQGKTWRCDLGRREALDGISRYPYLISGISSGISSFGISRLSTTCSSRIRNTKIHTSWDGKRSWKHFVEFCCGGMGLLDVTCGKCLLPRPSEHALTPVAMGLDLRFHHSTLLAKSSTHFVKDEQNMMFFFEKKCLYFCEAIFFVDLWIFLGCGVSTSVLWKQTSLWSRKILNHSVEASWKKTLQMSLPEFHFFILKNFPFFFSLPKFPSIFFRKCVFFEKPGVDATLWTCIGRAALKLCWRSSSSPVEAGSWQRLVAARLWRIRCCHVRCYLLHFWFKKKWSIFLVAVDVAYEENIRKKWLFKPGWFSVSDFDLFFFWDDFCELNFWIRLNTSGQTTRLVNASRASLPRFWLSRFRSHVVTAFRPIRRDPRHRNSPWCHMMSMMSLAFFVFFALTKVSLYRVDIPFSSPSTKAVQMQCFDFSDSIESM